MTMRRRRLLKLAAPVLSAPALAIGAYVAAEQNDPGAFVRNLAQRAIDDLARAGVNDAERESRFTKLFRDNFDVPLIARFVIGRYWRLASETERQEYLTLFDKFVIQTYLRRFTELHDVRIRVAAVGKPNEDGDVLVVTDGEMAGKPSVKLEIRVRRYADQSLRIIDIAVEGISMAVTQRDEFSSVIQRGGGQVQALIAALRERTTTP